MNLSEKLVLIQNEIHAPKNLENRFGGFNYRNAESICEAAKPILLKHKASLTLEDNVMVICDRVYVHAIATLRDCESAETIVVSAFAREPISKKGMDEPQITGACSSYARKYALNGLFLLDDTKDPDSNEYKIAADNKAENKEIVNKETVNDKITKEQVKQLKAESIRTGTTSDKLKEIFKVSSINDMTQVQYQVAMKKMKSLESIEQEAE